MNYLRILALAALGSYSVSASAEDVGKALEAFGLVGTWSTDCFKDRTKGGASRMSFAVHYPGTPIMSVEIAHDPSQTIGIEYEIQSAQVTADSIKLDYDPINVTESQNSQLKHSATPRTEKFTAIIEKVGEKIRNIETCNASHDACSVRNGTVYVYKDPLKQTGLHDTGQATPFLERCPN